MTTTDQPQKCPECKQPVGYGPDIQCRKTLKKPYTVVCLNCGRGGIACKTESAAIAAWNKNRVGGGIAVEEFTPCETCEEWSPERVSCPGCVFWDLIQDFIRLQNALAEAVINQDESVPHKCVTCYFWGEKEYCAHICVEKHVNHCGVCQYWTEGGRK